MPTPAFLPCIPTRGAKVPNRAEWIQEIKHDGYHLIIQREGKRVHLFTRNGHDWSDRYPLIVEAALRNRNSSLMIDGEAVLLGVYGRSDFNRLHSSKHDVEVEFYAFAMLVIDGEDMRKLPLSLRKTNLARLLPAVLMAFTSRSSSRARSVPIYSANMRFWDRHEKSPQEYAEAAFNRHQ